MPVSSRSTCAGWTACSRSTPSPALPSSRPGLLGPEAEALLAEHGLTLGHFPQSFEYASVGGFAATRSSGQASSGYGRFDALVLGLRVATPLGTLELGSAPASAAGPDLRELVLGSEGAFGVITAVTVRVRPVPATTAYDGWRFDSFEDGATALRTLAQSDLAPTVLRLSDENETAINLARPDEVGGASTGGCLLLAGFEGSVTHVEGRRAAVTARLEQLGGGAARRGGRPGLAGRSLLRPLPARLDARRGRAGRDPRDRDVLVAAARPQGRCHRGADRRARGPGPRALPRLARLRERRLALLHRRGQAGRVVGPGRPRAVGRGQDRGVRGDPRRRRHDHPPPRGRPRPQAVAGPRDRTGGVEMLRAVKHALDPAGVLNPGVLVP